MTSLVELLALLEQEAEGHHLWAVELIAEGTVEGEAVEPERVVELAARHQGASEAYRHALAQLRLVIAAQEAP